MAKHIILGIQLTNRHIHAGVIQKLLTKYGCYIKTRVGLHDVHGNLCSQTGIIILEMFGEQKNIDEFIKKLKAVDGVILKKMVFD